MEAYRDSAPASRVLEAVDRLFYNQGYTATGINQIINEAGVARASFYQHFPSKKDLAVAYLEHRHDVWMKKLRDYLSVRSTPGAQLEGLFDYLAEWLPSVDYRGCAFLNMASEAPVLGADIKSVIARHKSELRGLVREIVDRLEVPRPSEKADVVYVLFEGAIVESQVVQDVWPIDTARMGARQLLEAPG